MELDELAHLPIADPYQFPIDYLSYFPRLATVARLIPRQNCAILEQSNVRPTLNSALQGVVWLFSSIDH
jgi:hypothetical protein